MRKRSILAVLTAAAMVATMAVPVMAEEEAGWKIGFSQCTLASPFYTTMKDVAEAYAEELGIEFSCVSADDDVVKQNNDVNDMIASGIDALIINPMNEEGIKPALEACEAAGIPVITVDRSVSEGATAEIGRDNKTMGNMVGTKLAELLGGEEAEGVLIEVQGTSGDAVMMARRDGFHEAFEAACPNVEIVQSAYCDYTRSKAVTAVQDLVTSHENIIAVYGHNDDMSLGAAQVLQEKGIEGVLVAGVDGLMEAVIAMNEGNYAVTTTNDPGSLLKVAMDTAITILEGGEYEEFVDAGSVLIDETNVADYVNEDLAFAAVE